VSAAVDDKLVVDDGEVLWASRSRLSLLQAGVRTSSLRRWRAPQMSPLLCLFGGGEAVSSVFCTHKNINFHVSFFPIYPHFYQYWTRFERGELELTTRHIAPCYPTPCYRHVRNGHAGSLTAGSLRERKGDAEKKRKTEGTCLPPITTRRLPAAETNRQS